MQQIFFLWTKPFILGWNNKKHCCCLGISHHLYNLFSFIFVCFVVYFWHFTRSIDFPPEVVRGETLFTNMIIDETTSQPSNNCDDVFVYITDTVEPGETSWLRYVPIMRCNEDISLSLLPYFSFCIAIVVYDSGRDLTWRLSHPAMFPDPNFAQSNILGQRFTLMDGIVGITFDPTIGVVYFQPLATDRYISMTTHFNWLTSQV